MKLCKILHANNNAVGLKLIFLMSLCHNQRNNDSRYFVIPGLTRNPVSFHIIIFPGCRIRHPGLDPGLA